MVPISLLELKQTLLILCNTQDYNQLVNEEFALAADHNRCVSRFRFEAMLKVISKLFCYFGEGQNYGPQFIYGWVEEVFEQVHYLLCFLSMNMFNNYRSLIINFVFAIAVSRYHWTQ
jgi:hypothetical protein